MVLQFVRGLVANVDTNSVIVAQLMGGGILNGHKSPISWVVLYLHRHRKLPIKEQVHSHGVNGFCPLQNWYFSSESSDF